MRWLMKQAMSGGSTDAVHAPRRDAAHRQRPGDADDLRFESKDHCHRGRQRASTPPRRSRRADSAYRRAVEAGRKRLDALHCGPGRVTLPTTITGRQTTSASASTLPTWRSGPLRIGPPRKCKKLKNGLGGLLRRPCHAAGRVDDVRCSPRCSGIELRHHTQDFDTARRRMVETQLQAEGIRSTAVLQAMGKYSRHLFVPPERDRAYENCPLHRPRSDDFAALHRRLHDKALQLTRATMRCSKSARGRAQAAAAELAREVLTIEIVPPLADRARAALNSRLFQHYRADRQRLLGWPGGPPFQRIIVTAAPDAIPQALVDRPPSAASWSCPGKRVPGDRHRDENSRGSRREADHCRLSRWSRSHNSGIIASPGREGDSAAAHRARRPCGRFRAGRSAAHLRRRRRAYRRGQVDDALRIAGSGNRPSSGATAGDHRRS